MTAVDPADIANMTGPNRRTPGVPTAGESAQLSETAGEPLPWQSELDVAIADIDSRLKHPRRRVTDEQPTLPQLGAPEVTSEMIDEIAWRVAELLQRDGKGPVQGTTVAAAIAKTVSAAPPPVRRAPVAPPPPESRKLSHGIALSIRIRRPLFRWPFRRRYRKQAMITFSDYRIT
jgi:hypothetical protein